MAIAFTLLGAALAWQASQLRMNDLGGGPGPGVLPLGLGLLLFGIGARLVLRGWRDRAEFGNLGRVGILAAVLALWFTLLEPIGFVAASAIALGLMFVAFNERRRPQLVALGAAGAVASYGLFSSILRVQLPVDPFGIWR